MVSWFDLWLAMAGVIGATWVAWYRATVRVARRRQVLNATSYPGPAADTPKVSVLVAAKDEEDHIEACVITLLDQDYPDFELVVVDDRSQDRTPVILRRLEASYAGRLRVLTVTSLSDGWFGKTNAMREAAAASRGEWLLLCARACSALAE